MKNIELYYKSILDFLGYVINMIRDNEENGNLQGEILDHLLELEITLRREERKINQLKNNTSKYENIDMLEDTIKYISDNLSAENIYHDFKVLESIITRINELLDVLEPEELDFLDEEYNSQKFTLEVVSKDLYSNKELNFIDAEENVLLVLNFDNYCINNIENCTCIISEINSLEVLINLLGKVDFKAILKDKYCILTNINYENNKVIFNYIDMIQVYMGNSIYEAKNSQYSINLKNHNKFSCIDKYTQFSDIIYILSEFNGEDSILNKYLKAYQVIENFMFRIPICELIDDTERMFNIRDFNRLYKKIEDNESKTISNFFKMALGEEDDNGVKLIDIIKNYIDEFKLNNSSKLQAIKESIVKKKFVSENDISTISNLNEMHTKPAIKNKLINVIASLVYQLRNSIVHNKATEFHLTNSNLDEDLACFIDGLVIPILIEIIFFLIINRCKCITYQSDKLRLYN